MAAAAAAAGAAAQSDSDWLLTRDGCLSCEEGLRSLAYHPSLNAILAVTNRSTVKVIDGTSGAVLQVSRLNGESGWGFPSGNGEKEEAPNRLTSRLDSASSGGKNERPVRSPGSGWL
eukprot:g16336.t1